jgi:hypothetical protein
LRNDFSGDEAIVSKTGKILPHPSCHKLGIFCLTTISAPRLFYRGKGKLCLEMSGEGRKPAWSK